MSAQRSQSESGTDLPSRGDRGGESRAAGHARDLCEFPPLADLSFPGCVTRRLTAREIDAYEGRLEFWDADAATAWICEPATPYHEEPIHGLAGLLRTIAHVRGSPIKCLGAMDLLVREPGGAPRRIMEADQSVYLHPGRGHLPHAPAMVVGEHDFPDVVLEVDHSTDARRGKLKLYEAWGFPELWIQVPDRPSPSRPRSRTPGLTVYRLEGGAYRIVGESLALPGWKAAEIGAALDETVPSAATVRVLERVGRTLGEREGTGPEDDALLGSFQRRSMARGLEQGMARGLEQGIARGLEQGMEAGIVHQRKLLCRMAERKFGPAVAEELADRIGTVTDPARLAEAGILIMDCDTGVDLLECAKSLAV